jgi:hypothetical protein
VQFLTEAASDSEHFIDSSHTNHDVGEALDVGVPTENLPPHALIDVSSGARSPLCSDELVSNNSELDATPPRGKQKHIW